MVNSVISLLEEHEYQQRALLNYLCFLHVDFFVDLPLTALENVLSFLAGSGHHPVPFLTDVCNLLEAHPRLFNKHIKRSTIYQTMKKSVSRSLHLRASLELSIFKYLPSPRNLNLTFENYHTSDGLLKFTKDFSILHEQHNKRKIEEQKQKNEQYKRKMI
jgi:hypothetical protein